MKIAFYALRPFDELPMVEKLSKEYGIDYVWTTEYPNENNLKLAEGCQAFSCTPCYMPTEWVDRLYEYGVSYYLTRSIGFDHLPMDYLKEKGCHVSTTTYPPMCVANYAIMLMLMCTRNMSQIMERAKVQDFSLKGKMGKDISDLTIGVVGTGNIGATVVKHLSGFGCKILAYNIFEVEDIKPYCEFVDLDTLFANSDVITLHLACNEDTTHIVNEDSIAKMKDGVMIINTARGPLIDTKALIKGLKSGKVAAAGLDVMENEYGLYYINRIGDVIDNDEMAILRSMPNVILSPHTAFLTETTVFNMVNKTFVAADKYSKGEKNPFEIL